MMHRFNLLVLIFLTKFLLTSQNFSKCATSTQGIVLLHHAYKSFQTEDVSRCLHECIEDTSCQSINYYMDERKCEHNTRTISMRPKDGYVVLSAISMNNPYRAAIGSSRDVPAVSCEEVKQINGNVGSGHYWISTPTGSKKVYCDMMRKDNSCSSYTTITDSTRLITHGITARTCDRYIAVKWYRLSGGAGVRMPTSCVPKYRCNTDAPGWLSQPHPSVEDGTVYRKVCFHWKSNCCYWNKVIRVRNCGNFYLYEFQPTPPCQLRYCSTN